MKTQEQENSSPLTLFYSYADQDEKWCEELEKHLSMLQRQKVIAGWHHRQILPGTDKIQIIDEHFFSAQITVLLISPDFLASESSHAEMELALERHTVGLSYVIPLLLRPVDWQPAPFAHLQVLPRNGKPVTTWDDQDEAFAHTAEEIRLVIEQWKRPRSLSLGPREPFLASARKDLPLVKRLKDDLRLYSLVGEKDQKTSYQGCPDTNLRSNRQFSKRETRSHSKIPYPVRLVPLNADRYEQGENEAMREAISGASAVILVATPHTRRSRSVKEVLRIAEMYQRSIYLFWMRGNHLIEVIPTDWNQLPTVDARDERYAQALQELMQALRRKTSFPYPSVKQPAPPLAPPRNPYKGLQAFRVEDAQDFFGRDRLIEERYDCIFDAVGKRKSSKLKEQCKTVLTPNGKYLSVDDGSPKLQSEDLLFLTELVEAGKIKPVIDRSYPLEQIVEAHRYVETGHKKGNVIITVE